MQRLLFAAVVAGALVTSRARADDWGPFAKPPTVTKLDNGLTVMTIPWASPGIVAYYTLVRVGSRDEVEKGHSGFAHLFEHMMFRGTERFPEKVYEERIQDFGADNNAYTTQDFTLYTITAPASALPEIIDIEADRFQHLVFSEQQFRTETGAVLGEYNKSASAPFLKMWEALSESAFKQHTYGHTTIGYLADIQAMPNEYAYAQAFFRRFYTPDASTIIVAGDVKHDEVVALVKQRYGAWSTKRDQPTVPVEPEPTQGGKRHLDWDGIATPQMMVAFRAPAFEGTGTAEERSARLRDTAALEVVHGLLFDEAAPLYQKLVVDEQLLFGFGSWSANYTRDPGLFVISAELKPDVKFDQIEQRIQAAIDEVAAGKTDPARIDAVRSHLRYGFTMHVETASDAADTLAQFVAATGDPGALPRYLEALAQVTPEDVARVARTYLRDTRRFTVTLAPKAKQEGTP